MVTLDRTNNSSRLVLSSNRSATWRQAKAFWLVFSFPCLLIAMAWVTAGAWAVLPFAGIEITLLFCAMRYVNGRCLYKQVIDISADSVVVVSGYKKPESRTVLHRPKAHVRVFKAAQAMADEKLSLTDGVSKITIGHFLNEDDRHHLRKLLQQSGLMVCRNRWWSS